MQDAGGLTIYATNNLNQYPSVGGVSHSYDDNGKLTSDGTNTYLYDAENRLTEVSNLSIVYTYDPQGRRISKEVDGKLTRYIYDGDQVICEYDGSGRLMRKFTYGTGIDEPVRMTVLHPSADIGGGGDTVDIEDIRTMAAAWLTEVGEGGFNANADLSFDGKIDNVDSDILSENWQTGGSRAAQCYYFHFDGLGNVIALTDSAGNTIETYAYDVYGSAIVCDTHDAILNTSSVGNPYFFTGRRFDNETALYYYRARYYSPTIGRFMQVDVIGYEDGPNLYVYVGNNPLNSLDPLGLCEETPWYYNPWVAGSFGLLGDAAGYVHDTPSSIISAAMGAEFGPQQRAGLSAAFYAGERAGIQIAANEYTFGGTDALGLTSASEKVSEYNKYKILGFKSGSASKFLGARSRDAAIAAALVGASGTNVHIEGPKGARLFQLRSVKTGKPVFRLDKAGMLRGKKIGPHYHRPPDMRLHRPQQGW